MTGRDPARPPSSDVSPDDDDDDTVDATLDDRMAIAVVGMAGRFPGANSVTELWQNLCDGRESIRRFERDELLMSGLSAEEIDHPDYVLATPVLDGCDEFDAFFFGYSPRDAELMDPQQRIFLECAWHALENAGYDAQRFAGKIGIFGGTAMNTYLLYSDVLAQFEDAYIPTLIGLDKDYLTTRVAYKMDLKGPAMTVQTACSSSLVATHLAYQSLLDEECDMALVGGVSVRVPQVTGYRYREGGVLSPDGHIHAFDRNARGTIFGSGVGICVLRRLEDALADGDTIHALILGTAINNDGAGKVDFTAPSVGSQSEVIAEALGNAEMEPRDIGYIEAHGSGTMIGDQVELAALNKVFAEAAENGFCALGSVKSNIGHLDAAAGVAGLIKAVLCLKHGVIPPNLHCDEPHDAAHPEHSPFYVNTTLRDWQPAAHEGPRRAGVTSLGIGGTNAHVIAEEPPPAIPSGPSRSHQLLLWSGRTRTAADQIADQLAEYLDQRTSAATTSLADVAYTLHVGRRAFEHRRALVATTADARDATVALRELDPVRIKQSIYRAGTRQVVFLFPGGGAQYPGMARDLYREEQVFRATVDACARAFARHLPVELLAVLYPESDADADAYATRPALALPALFATEIAMARLLESWGITPRALIGHSLGEYAAAHIAGVFSLDDACALVALRGRLFETLPRGAMLSTPLSAAELGPLIGRELSLAADNGPAATVASGPVDAIDALHQTLSERQIESRKLHIDVAAHSTMLDSILDEFRAGIARMRASAPEIPMVSNVTGTWLGPHQATDPDYWVTQLRQTVRFHDGLSTLLDEPNRVFLEVGPGRTLATFTRSHPERAAQQWVGTTVRHPRDARHDLAVLLETLGELWLAGVHLDEGGFWSGEERHRVPLPGYPFERQRHWIAGTRGQRQRRDEATRASRDSREPGAPIDERLAPADRFWKPVWVRVPGAPPEALARRARSWLIFTDELGLGDAIVSRLHSASQKVVVVRAGSGFAELTRDDATGVLQYAIAPESMDDMRSVFDAITGVGGALSKLDAVLWLWPLRDFGADAEAHHDHHLWESLTLARVLAERAPFQTPMRVLMVASGLFPVAGGAPLDPARATLLGPCRLLGREAPGVTASALDIPLPESGASRGEAADHIITEALRPRATSSIAVRANGRWLERQRALHIAPGNTGMVAGIDAIGEQATVLITGGLGDLGRACGEYLAKTRKARLVLISRTPLPERATWNQPGANGNAQSDEIRARIASIQTMEAAGASVMVASADIADSAAMNDVLSRVQERFGPVHAVLHTAGVLADGALALKERSEAETVLRAKVAGTRLLDRLFRERGWSPLMVLFSSINVYLAPSGQVDYVAANAFMDAFARARSERDPTISINWPGWTETGMATRIVARLGQGDRQPAAVHLEHPLLCRRLDDADTGSNTARASEGVMHAMYEASLDPNENWVLTEHHIAIAGRPDSPDTSDRFVPVLPATAMLEMVRAAFADATDGGGIAFEDVFFVAPLSGHRPCVVRVLLRQHALPSSDGAPGAWDFVLLSRTDHAGTWRIHATGRVRKAGASPGRLDPSELRIQCPTPLEDSDWSWVPGVRYGPRWHGLTQAYVGQERFQARIEAPRQCVDELADYPLHPALLDVATAVGVHLNGRSDDTLYVPYSYARLVMYRPLPAHFHTHVERRAYHRGTSVSFDGRLLDEDGETLVRFEDFVLVAADTSAVPADTPSRALRVTAPGQLDSMAWQSSEMRPPDPGQVVLALHACGLNFKDVLHALGLLEASELFRATDGTLALGMEAAGTVIEVAPDVTRFRPGDQVMVQAPQSFAERVVVDARYCVRKPDVLTHREAAALPVAYTTAIYALRHCARLRAGERILIHAATGGVGLAALAVARAAGAVVLATAGTPEKRRYLHELGIEHVFDSRSLEFAEGVRAATDGQGVDVVLNSLGGDFIEASLSILRPFGRFCELGLRDIIADRSLALGVFRKGIALHAINMEHMWTERPDLLSELLSELADDIRSGRLHALPVVDAPLEQAAEVFDAMAQARHIGKFVLRISEVGDGPGDRDPVARGHAGHRVRTDGSDSAVPEWVHSLLAEPVTESASASSDPVMHNLTEGLSTEEAMDALERILSIREEVQVLVCPTDFVTRVEAFDTHYAQTSGVAASTTQSDGQETTKTAHPRPDLSTPFVPPEGEIEQTIADLWAQILGIAEVGVHDRFAELGGDSLKGARVISSVNTRLHTKLSATDFFAAPTVRSLAQHIAAELGRRATASKEDGGIETEEADESATETNTRADRRRELMRRRQRSRERGRDTE